MQCALVSSTKRFSMYCTGNNMTKQVQGGSVIIIEPGTLCVSQRPKKRCVKFWRKEK